MTREEAINKVRQMSLPKETMDILEALAPELKESEDERIIEEIKFAVMQMPSSRQDTKNRCLAWLEKQKEQKPAEWSEKEEKRIQRIYDFLWKNRKGDTDTIYQIEKDADWLKSLRPDSYKNCNSRWKPSEEQMAMLLAVINEPNNAMAESCQLALKSFYEHFKKLM